LGLRNLFFYIGSWNLSRYVQISPNTHINQVKKNNNARQNVWDVLDLIVEFRPHLKDANFMVCVFFFFYGIGDSNRLKELEIGWSSLTLSFLFVHFNPWIKLTPPLLLQSHNFSQEWYIYIYIWILLVIECMLGHVIQIITLFLHDNTHDFAGIPETTL
jgi:hypothetical protein